MLAAMAMTSAAQAQGYLSLAAGTTHLSTDCSGTLTCDKTGTGFRIAGGYRFLPYLGAELNYFDFGKAKASAIVDSTLLAAEIKTTGIGAGIMLRHEFTPGWSGMARLGVARVKADVSGSAVGLTVSDKENSTQAYVGLGVGYAVTKSVSLTANYDGSRSKYSGETGDVRLLSLGVHVDF